MANELVGRSSDRCCRRRKYLCAVDDDSVMALEKATSHQVEA